ncbi:hypothetical protein [Planococcus shenhongbingii]|uniref:Homing endonuclease LAGLIDADG domain-containing protein n=1 Tax=Planococcus shenhongbingii TaxID=3058398 RepID=A0ABT8NGS4_9BACL|nr:hypothetical protein [Planococcus sp. N017]MDN7247105.1 hypothetical protein [Planococcus sp. N017]
MEKLAKAMKSRGFLISQESDSIYFNKGNADEELSLVKEMFNNIGANVVVEDRKIYVNEPLTEEQLQRIIWYPARNHEAGGGSEWRSWKYFSRRNHGAKVNTFVLETGVAHLVKTLSAAGFSTNSSCDGHGRRSPNITFSGRLQATWFDILFQEAKAELKLDYDWEFKKNGAMDPKWIANTRTGKWNLHTVLEDTGKIACYFFEHAEEISNTRKTIFGKCYKSTRKMVRSMTDEELYSWMRKEYKQYKIGKAQ